MPMTAPAQYSTCLLYTSPSPIQHYNISDKIRYRISPKLSFKFIKKIVHKIKISFQNVYSDAYCKKHKLCNILVNIML